MNLENGGSLHTSTEIEDLDSCAKQGRASCHLGVGAVWILQPIGQAWGQEDLLLP